MNRKTRSDAIIPGLPPQRRQLIEAWLLEENISYRDASRRYLEMFNQKIDPTTFGAHYRRLRTQSLIAEIAESIEQAGALCEHSKNNKFCEAFTLLAGHWLFKQALSSTPPLADDTIAPVAQSTAGPESVPTAHLDTAANPPASPSLAPSTPTPDSAPAANPNSQPQPDGPADRPLAAMTAAARLFSTAMKLNLAKENLALKRQHYQLELHRFELHRDRDDGGLDTRLFPRRRKGGITLETLAEIEEGAKLL